MSDAKKCDRCGKFYLESENADKRATNRGLRTFGVSTFGISGTHIVTYELCVECANKFYLFMKEKED